MSDGFEHRVGLNPLDPSDRDLDLDNDGLSNLEEFNLGTRIDQADIDGDGLSDGYEVDNGLDPNADSASFDADSDGLTNLEEFNLGTSANDPDTDNDELSDGDEVNIHGTDPLNADTDGGNDPDGFEVARNANPLDPTDDIRVFFDHVLIDAENFRWDITRDGRIREGTSNAYDSGLDIFINEDFLDEESASSFGISEDEGREILIGPQAIDNVLLSRKIYVPTDNNFARYLELIENPSASEVTIDVRIRSNLGSNSETVVIASSSGDTELGNDDTYIVTDDALDGSDSPALLHLWGNANSGLNSQESSLSGDRLSSDFSLTIPANSTVALMHIASQNATQALAIDKARELQAIPDALTQGMSLDEREAVVNFELAIDSDGDGLSDLREQQIGTDPNNPDTDGDSLPDDFEHRVGLNPLDPSDRDLDLDNDGLSNLEEFNLGTRVDQADTDGDGLQDGAEVTIHNTSPVLSDTDADGLFDGFEITFNFDPLGVDESALDGDGDGLTNVEEQTNRTNPLLADTDGDGVNDLEDGVPTDPTTTELRILLVSDLDPGNTASLQAYQSALDNLGATSTVWTSADGLPSRELLAQNRLTIWFTGEFGFLNQTEEQHLASYLDGGGCFLLSSQDYHFNRDFTPFMSTYLGLESVRDDAFTETSVDGVGSLYPSPVSYSLDYDFGNFADFLTLREEAQALFTGFGNGLQRDRIAGSLFDSGTFSATYLGFPLEAVSDDNERTDIINRVVQQCAYRHNLSPAP